MIITVNTIVSVILLATAFFTPFSSFAPNFCATKTANPLVSPNTRPFTKKNSELHAANAASALTPTNLPTIIVSTIL